MSSRNDRRCTRRWRGEGRSGWRRDGTNWTAYDWERRRNESENCERRRKYSEVF